MAPTYQIHSLPLLSEFTTLEENPQYTFMAQRYRNLRLWALKTAPEAFASSYRVEEKRGLKQTWARLSNPKVINLIATETDNGFSEHQNAAADELRLILGANWVGSIALIGLQHDESGAVSAKEDPFAKTTSSRTSLPEGEKRTEDEKPSVLHYHINGLFVDPSARGAGLGLALVEVALSRAREQAERESASLWVSVIVNEGNECATKVYEKAGFTVVGKETYIQQPRSLAGEARAEEKVALLMELRAPVNESQVLHPP